MNPMKKKIEERLNLLPDIYSPIKEISRKYLKYCSTISTDNSVCIGHYPVEYPGLYTIQIFERIQKNWRNIFEKKLSMKIPKIYLDFLQNINGCSIFNIDLFGLTPSIYKENLLDRTIAQCLNLDFANQDWIKEYKTNQKNLFHFGGREYTETENIGYFIDPENNIIALLKSGQIIASYESITAFLKSEIEIAEKIWLSNINLDWY